MFQYRRKLARTGRAPSGEEKEAENRGGRRQESKERQRSEKEERRIARGQDGKREQKTREKYGLPRSRPGRHGAHCLAGCPRGNIDPFLSFSLSLVADEPFDQLSHWDTKVESSPLSPLVSAPAAERPCLHRTASPRWGTAPRASTLGGSSHTTMGRTNARRRKGRATSFFFSHAAPSRAFTSPPGRPKRFAYTYTY